VNITLNDDAHEQARKLIALAGPEALAAADQIWLAAHLQACASCGAFAENARETIHALRAIPIAAERSLISTTQMRVRRRALELQRQRERLWLVSLSCTAVTLCTLLSTVAMWRGFEWLGAVAQLPSSVWQTGFLVFGVTPALVVGILLLARGTNIRTNVGTNINTHSNTHLADHAGSYQG
jgi:hypothetical protein